ncbi:F0F1 ATP synthase subunit B [Pseudaestuariivita atlantica]|uniref:ATP synthase subunit b n=1 Tax=Pseudaestuariivita atlantica TaxID=1317121 RepID=A0A0L1JSI2_9RHOB|nr:F0F1 ATP synthase subunit B [Pseudaestuariivita atlantica]KNG94744.1 ATP F0F1 synthase subunit B [Pseudaestuariivita atlantica]
MQNRLTLWAVTASLAVVSSPALAAPGPFFSLRNTDFVVLIAFLIFVGVLLYLKVFNLLGGLLDKRAAGIRDELDEARKLREDAQAILASYERKQAEVQEQAQRIIDTSKREAAEAAEKAKADLQVSIERRLAAAEDQIASAEASAVKEVRDTAIGVATAAARDVVAKQLTAEDADKMIEDAIAEVDTRLH